MISALLFCAAMLGTQAPAVKAQAPAVKAVAKPAAAPSYVPDLKLWHMDVSPDLGGWFSDRTVNLRIKLVDPKDPNPPKDEARRWNDYGDEGEGEESEGGEDTRTAAQLRQARLAREAEVARQAWRQRTLKVWLNGSALTWSTRVGYTTSEEITAQNGENRLEILEPESGLRVVRSWWVSTARTRLRVLTIQSGGEYVSGNLQVLEPDGAVAEGGRRTPSGGMLRWSGEYTHDTPPAGTYTLKWTGGWRGGKPARVRVEALLDGGTDQERRWSWERLILPGAGPVTLGTFDVEP
ncbi:hypothetical protein [Geothrix limicola]|uniref:hypothetical protein n=1 Tax=Geothrix limicola TaxID=2927978 RepID=UPI002553ECB9|nr:hypothetical protein [Geothrix limicola]